MSRGKLNELCQKYNLGTPNYSYVQQGQDHMPLFKASVEVDGSTFHSCAFFKSSRAAKDDVAAIAFQHFSTFYLEVDMKKLKLTSTGSCSNKDKGALKETTKEIPPPDLAVPTGSCSNKDKGALKETAMEIPPPDLAVPTTDEPEPDMNKSVKSYLLCNKVRVYTSIPDVVLPKGCVVLPIAEGKWTIVSLE